MSYSFIHRLLQSSGLLLVRSASDIEEADDGELALLQLQEAQRSSRTIALSTCTRLSGWKMSSRWHTTTKSVAEQGWLEP